MKCSYWIICPKLKMLIHNKYSCAVLHEVHHKYNKANKLTKRLQIQYNKQINKQKTIQHHKHNQYQKMKPYMIKHIQYTRLKNHSNKSLKIQIHILPKTTTGTDSLTTNFP